MIPGQSITFYEYPAALAARVSSSSRCSSTARRADDQKSRRSSSRRASGLDRRWMLMASYSDDEDRHSALAEHGEHGQRLHACRACRSSWPRSIRTRRSTRRTRSGESTARLDGAYILPWSMQVSANFEHRSGQPWAQDGELRGAGGSADSDHRAARPSRLAPGACRTSTCCTCASRSRCICRRGASWRCG